MTGSRKNKKQSFQSTTLLNFFPPGASSSNTQSNSQRKQTRRKKSSVTLPPNQHEIIVIDSDSEDECISKKKRRLSEEIEFVEAKATESYVPFGKPTTLLLGSTVVDSPTVIAPTSFGKPSVLLRSLKDNMEHDEDDIDVDEWGTGDDEFVQEEDLNDEEQDILLKISAPESRTAIPISKPLGLPKTLVPKASLGSNAYSILMSSHKENEAWKEAAVVEDRGFRPSKANGGRRKAPFYKILQGMPIAVDAFKYGTIPGVNAYFLTHAHSDHYQNLSNTWNSGPIYCSEGTARLIIHMLKVDPSWVHPLPMDVPTDIPNTGGVRVTLIEANHCPGSCLFFFEGRQTVDAGDSTFQSCFVGSTKTFRYLHCGDFRASPAHVLHPAVKGKRIDHVYLDTTYLDPRYTFPPQPLVISACAELAKRIQDGDSLSEAGTMNSWITAKPNADSKGKGKEKANPTPSNVLMVVGTYSIGKERIVKAIARTLQSKIYCDSRKTAILRCQSDPELHALLTKNPLEAQVHIVPLGHVNLDKLKEYGEKYKHHFRKIIGFRPTGWTFTQPAGTDQVPSIEMIISRAQRSTFMYSDLRQGRGSSSTLQVYPVPYSEHSSFFELTCFAMSFEWGKMIATVNVGSETSRGKMAKWVEKWEKERKKKGEDYVVPRRKEDYW